MKNPTLKEIVSFAENSEDCDTFAILEAARKMRKIGEGHYSKMIFTGELDFSDYGAGFINFEIFHTFDGLSKKHFARIWFATIDDGDMGAWVEKESKEEAIKFIDNFAESYLKNLEIFPTLDVLNRELCVYGIWVSRE